MNKIIKKKHHLIIPLICLVFSLTSCINQKSSNKTSTGKLPDSTVKESEYQKESVPQLKFESMIRSIFEDSKGNFWFGSDQEGVCKYDGESFTYFTTEDGLSDNQIRTIQEDQQGNIWFATGYGVCRYDGEKVTSLKAKNVFGLNGVSGNKWGKEATDLWFNGEVEGGIYRYDGQNLSVLEFPKLDLDQESFSITGTVTGVCYGKNDMLWMANYGGVLGYNGESFTYINKRGVEYHVRSIFEDSKGKLWIGNNGIGVLLYDGNTTINFTKENGLDTENAQRNRLTTQDGTLNHVFTITEDRNGNIWFGDRDTGAWRYDGSSLVNYTIKNGLPGMFVRTIYKDKKGDLWFGMERGNVCKFNGESFEKIFYKTMFSVKMG